MLQSDKAIKETDSGWLREAINNNQKRITAARLSKKKAFIRAARSYDSLGNGWITLSEWTDFISTECSPFDPRRSEWTALEIIRQLVYPIVGTLAVTEKRLDRLHPNNILIAESWKTLHQDSACISWEQWRLHMGISQKRTSATRLRDSATSVIDYRYFTNTQNAQGLDAWGRRLVSVGRLLLGLLRFNHGSPSLWNLRGNEQIIELPRAQILRSLAISTPTLLLLNGCLSGRSAETRAILQKPGLFGWKDGIEINDADFDPPLLIGPNELLDTITNAQRVLKENQLAIAMNQPRQLIPFRLKDFAAGADSDGEEVHGE